MGCAVTMEMAPVVCKEEETPLEPPTGSWTPILALDLSAADRKALHEDDADQEDLHASPSASSCSSCPAYLEALSILAMLPGAGKYGLYCTRQVYGLTYGATAQDATALDDEAFQGVLALTRCYSEAMQSSQRSSCPRSLAAPLRHACVTAQEGMENRDTNHFAVVVLVNGPVATEAYEETLSYVLEAQRLGVAVLCLGIGGGSFESFLEETLPELCSNFKFLSLNELTGEEGVRPHEGRSHCAWRINKAVVEALTSFTPEAERRAKLKKGKTCPKFCTACGCLPSSAAADRCSVCRAGTEEKDVCLTPATTTGSGWTSYDESLDPSSPAEADDSDDYEFV